MSKNYTHVKVFEEEIFKLKSEGKSNREIREQYGMSKVQLKNLINRHNRSERQIEEGFAPRRRGRPRSNPILAERQKDNEIKRLQMENELLRDFLRAVGRK
jgi:transposase